MLLALTLLTRGNLASTLVGGYGHGMTVDPLESFPLTLADAGERLSMSPEAVAELVRLGSLGAYLAPGRPDGPPPTLRFTAVDVRAFTASDDPATARLVATVAALLRRYLRGCSPIPRDEDDPVLAQDRGRAVHAHVQRPAFARWIRAAATPDAATDPRVYLTDSLRIALHRLGCRRMRAIRPLHSDTMVWADWWRIPQSLWSLSLEEMTQELAR